MTDYLQGSLGSLVGKLEYIDEILNNSYYFKVGDYYAIRNIETGRISACFDDEGKRVQAKRVFSIFGDSEEINQQKIINKLADNVPNENKDIIAMQLEKKISKLQNYNECNCKIVGNMIIVQVFYEDGMISNTFYNIDEKGNLEQLLERRRT